ncbi:hypothetical protein SNOG_03324 [Parastagonospora nodorum SN15]|uniref:Uncharacterized protein n=1 Tax=Phaeosphaeria nodorum (strain SN15 / ATCC MYA-4574 / FGSC 10173) TaxID=321614 RepID=Q0UY40_PHANO|nr:hypothetical protein SNOG_03324 [Parastagonospora nodorum SN15]EAT90055.1 hypothetical protein SNOG_03324 [Parastagonospora nodorum SN15]
MSSAVRPDVYMDAPPVASRQSPVLVAEPAACVEPTAAWAACSALVPRRRRTAGRDIDREWPAQRVLQLQGVHR